MKELHFTDEQLKQFKEDGYVAIENYFDDGLCDQLREECSRMINEMNPEEHNTVFSTEGHEYMKENYFLSSGDKIRYFWEANAHDEKGNLVRPKHLALNKIGHALHILNPLFKKATFTEKISAILRKLQYRRPIIPQSMYIFKQPGIGGEVVKHMDASFLESTPMKLTGFWIPLEDATLENGCLWFAPGSHKNAEVTYRMVRNSESSSSPILKFIGELETEADDKFVPVPAKKGTLVLIDGKVQHRSNKNTSDRSRHVYTFHASESYESTWSKRNWLQPTESTPFPIVYDDSA